MLNRITHDSCWRGGGGLRNMAWLQIHKILLFIRLYEFSSSSSSTGLAPRLCRLDSHLLNDLHVTISFGSSWEASLGYQYFPFYVDGSTVVFCNHIFFDIPNKYFGICLYMCVSFGFLSVTFLLSMTLAPVVGCVSNILSSDLIPA